MYWRQVTLFVGGFISQSLTIQSVLGQGLLVIQHFGKSEFWVTKYFFATDGCHLIF